MTHQQSRSHDMSPHHLSDEEVTELVQQYIKNQERERAIQLPSNPWDMLAPFMRIQLRSKEHQEFHKLNQDLPERCEELLHMLSVQGILMPQPGTQPYVRTRRGDELLATDVRILTDPSGYLRAVQAIHGVDELTLEYLAEAVESHRMFLDRSAAVMLGGAAENLLLRLGQALAEPLENLKRQVPGGLADWRISRVRTAIEQTLNDANLREAVKAKLSGISQPMTADEEEALRQLESALTVLSRLYADTRNDAGHPKPISPDRKLLYAYLQALPGYARVVSTLIRLLQRVP